MSVSERVELAMVFVHTIAARLTAHDRSEFLDKLGAKFTELHLKDFAEQTARTGDVETSD